MEFMEGKSCIEWAKCKLWKKEQVEAETGRDCSCHEKRIQNLNDQFDKTRDPKLTELEDDLNLIFNKLKAVSSYVRSNEMHEGTLSLLYFRVLFVSDENLLVF